MPMSRHRGDRGLGQFDEVVAGLEDNRFDPALATLVDQTEPLAFPPPDRD